jgi:hypothetical protein
MAFAGEVYNATPLPAGFTEQLVRVDDSLGTPVIRFEHVQVPERDVLAYLDSLRPIAPGDIDFKRD